MPDQGLRGVVSVLNKSDNKRKLHIQRTSGETDRSDATATGSGCTRRGYKTFLRLLYEFIEVTEKGNDKFEDCVEDEYVDKCDIGDVSAE